MTFLESFTRYQRWEWQCFSLVSHHIFCVFGSVFTLYLWYINFDPSHTVAMLHNGHVYRQGTLGKFEYIMMTSSNGSIFHVTGSAPLAFVRGPVNSPRKGLWRRALMFSLIRINGWVKNREAGDLRRHRTHYDVIVMMEYKLLIHVTQTTCESLLIICYLKVLLKYSIVSNATIHLMVYIIMKCNYML